MGPLNIWGCMALCWSDPNSTHPHCIYRLVFEVGNGLCLHRADRCMVYRQTVYIIACISVYTQQYTQGMVVGEVRGQKEAQGLQ